MPELPTIDNRERCETCRFYRLPDSFITSGTCHHSAPSGNRSGKPDNSFSAVSIDEWCGDYRPVGKSNLQLQTEAIKQLLQKVQLEMLRPASIYPSLMADMIHQLTTIIGEPTKEP